MKYHIAAAFKGLVISTRAGLEAVDKTSEALWNRVLSTARLTGSVRVVSWLQGEASMRSHLSGEPRLFAPRSV